MFEKIKEHFDDQFEYLNYLFGLNGLELKPTNESQLSGSILGIFCVIATIPTAFVGFVKGLAQGDILLAIKTFVYTIVIMPIVGAFYIPYCKVTAMEE